MKAALSCTLFLLFLSNVAIAKLRPKQAVCHFGLTSLPRAGGQGMLANGERFHSPESDKLAAVDPGNAFTANKKKANFSLVIIVACFNILLNTLRPDQAISWQMRFPRVLWEFAIAIIASWTSLIRPIPAVYLLLSIVTGTTALVDIFFWMPIFAMFSNFEECTGGGLFSREPKICNPDYIKGIGRLAVSAQCMFSGLFYLMTAIIAWGSFTAIRDEQIIERQVRAHLLVSNNEERKGRIIMS